MAVRSSLRALAVAPLVVIGACKSGGTQHAPPADEAYHAHVITSDAIEKSGATDAWEVIKRLSTTARATETSDGQPQRLHPRRGHGSILLRDDVQVYVDGVELLDLRLLRQMGASDVDTMEEMGSGEATAFFGSNNTAGAILIHSRNRPPDQHYVGGR